MSIMNVSLPDAPKAFAGEQVTRRGYDSGSSEYVRELIQRDQVRQRLQALLLAGAASPVGLVANAAWFGALRRAVQTRAA